MEGFTPVAKPGANGNDIVNPDRVATAPTGTGCRPELHRNVAGTVSKPVIPCDQRQDHDNEKPDWHTSVNHGRPAHVISSERGLPALKQASDARVVGGATRSQDRFVELRRTIELLCAVATPIDDAHASSEPASATASVAANPCIGEPNVATVAAAPDQLLSLILVL